MLTQWTQENTYCCLLKQRAGQQELGLLVTSVCAQLSISHAALAL